MLSNDIYVLYSYENFQCQRFFKLPLTIEFFLATHSGTSLVRLLRRHIHILVFERDSTSINFHIYSAVINIEFVNLHKIISISYVNEKATCKFEDW